MQQLLNLSLIFSLFCYFLSNLIKLVNFNYYYYIIKSPAENEKLQKLLSIAKREKLDKLPNVIY